MPQLQFGCEAHRGWSAGLLVLVRAGRDLDHKNHWVFCLVAEGAANYIHSVLMRRPLQTLTVHRQQLIPCLQMQ